MDNNQEKTKQSFSNAWKKAAELGKKAADNTKKFVDQTKENIHEQKAKRYKPITAKEFKLKSFKMPIIIMIEDDSANREYVEADDAIAWIEVHKEIPVLHMYNSFVKKSGIAFIPVPQRDNVYCQDNFEIKKYINVNQVFGKATEEKLAELNNIAFCLGAKSCSIEIIEEESEVESKKVQVKGSGKSGEATKVEINNSNASKQSGKNVSNFKGHDNPQMPVLKWFAHDDNVKLLIDMRLKKAIQSNVLELKGSNFATMSKSIACAIDAIIKVSGSLSMEKQVQKEHSNKLLFEIEF
jgi:hypothetical protein